ncbi:histone deacetylase family protein [Bremerella sp. P1]|uniref:histone deacetylase family protein n=1 Tax=Bremerella sp. P1 TaxID=3026424 RepID=UPI00236776AE|nr:histone deacetylase [Bremerella sp. P1]WDI44045.1 histone deacetylase [Bremerella sp. P1]
MTTLMDPTQTLKVFHSDSFPLPLPSGHRFPIDKYAMLRERLQSGGMKDRLEFCIPSAVTDDELLLVHTNEYLEKLQHGTLSSLEQRRIGFPWSPEMVERSRRSTGGTLGAARAALTEGAGAHLAGGTHHAFADHGQGFCVFNDVAVTVRVLQAEQRIRSAVVIDLDVHQGNGTASIFLADPSVFTFSMHGDKNFPFSKCNGDLDIALPKGTSDSTYLELLSEALARLPLSDVDIAFYLAGADCYEHDRLGTLKLTQAGLLQRDEMVFQACQTHHLPVALAMAGGYADNLEDIATIHCDTTEAMLKSWSPG